MEHPADDHLRDEFLKAEKRLTNAFLLVKHIDECRKHADEITFFQRVRKQINKIITAPKKKKDLDRAVRDLVDDHVESEGVVDIFKLSGIETPDLSILDDSFLQTFKNRPHQDLRLRLLQKLLADEINLRGRRNIAKASSFRSLLQEALENYHKRTIDAAAVIKTMLEIKKELEADRERAEALGLSAEELAFYDAIHSNYESVYDNPFLCEVVHEVVRVIKENLKVDWTEPHRDDVKATVRSAVRRTLRKKKVKPEDFDGFLDRVLEQAIALWKDWPFAA